MPNLANYNLAIIISETRRGNQIKAVNRDLALLKSQANRAVGASSAVAASQTKMGQAMGIAGRVMRNILIPGFLIGSIVATKFAVDGVREFAKFDEAMRNTFTLLPGISEVSMGALSDDVRDAVILGQQAHMELDAMNVLNGTEDNFTPYGIRVAKIGEYGLGMSPKVFNGEVAHFEDIAASSFLAETHFSACPINSS